MSRGLGDVYKRQTLMLGYKTAEKLHVMDKIQASDEAVEHLDDILFHRIPYVSDYI